MPAGQGATTGQGMTAGNRARRQGAGSMTHDGRARRLGMTRQRGKARRSSTGRATTRRLTGSWAGRRLVARRDGWQGDDQTPLQGTALQGDDQARRLTNGQGAMEGKTRRGQGAGHTTTAGSKARRLAGRRPDGVAGQQPDATVGGWAGRDGGQDATMTGRRPHDDSRAG